MDVSKIESQIRNYIVDTYHTTEYLVYGSFAEYKSGYIVTPHDIDIIIALKHQLEPITFQLKLPNLDLPLEITLMAHTTLFDEVRRLEPKYLDVLYPASGYALYSEIEEILDRKTIPEIRSAISSISSKAFNKGKKKLIMVDDYDEYLGLKNIYHAFKFVHYAIHRLSSFVHYDTQFLKDKNIMEMYDIKRLIFDTYQNSTGTLEERWKTLDSVIKPLYNTYMTQFRKLFPKGEP